MDHKSGRVLTDMKDLEFPSHYSQTACDIIASKYFRKAGVPGEPGYETSMRQVSDRMVSFWVKALLDEGMIDEEESVILTMSSSMPYWRRCLRRTRRSGSIRDSSSSTASPGMNELYYYDEEKGEVVMSEDDYIAHTGVRLLYSLHLRSAARASLHFGSLRIRDKIVQGRFRNRDELLHDSR